jgi:ribosomal protein L7Ae-like RNA K-turn-binding protein
VLDVTSNYKKFLPNCCHKKFVVYMTLLRKSTLMQNHVIEMKLALLCG